MTIKEYAEARGVSYEAVRRMIKRHFKDMEAHIFQPGHNQPKQIDAEGVELLDSWRSNNPVVVVSPDRAAELERLRDENKAWLARQSTACKIEKKGDTLCRK